MSPAGWLRVLARVPETVRYEALLNLVVLIWGFTGVLGRLITLDSAALVFYRVVIAVPFIAAYLVARGATFRVAPKALAVFFVQGLLVATHWSLFFHAIKISTVSVGLVCMSTAPFVSSIIEPLVFRRRFRASELTLGVVAVIGMALIFGFETQYARGIAVGLTSAALGACFMVGNGRLVAEHDARVMSLYELVGAMLGLFAFLLVVRRPVGSIPVPAGTDIVYLLVLGTVCTAFAFMGGNYVMRRLSPFTVLLTTNLEPVFGIILALLVFGDSEVMSPGFYAGAGVILVSIWVNAIIVRRRIPELGEEPHGDHPTHHPDAA